MINEKDILKFHFTILLDSSKSKAIIKYLENRDIINLILCNKFFYYSLIGSKVIVKNAMKRFNKK